MKIKVLNTEVNISILIIVMPALMLLAGYLREYAAAFISITLHELGHLSVSRIYGFKLCNLKITPVGFSMSINDRNCSRWTSVKIYSAGPAINLIIFGAAELTAYFYPAFKEYLRLLSSTNVILALFNMLPVYPLDGGRILLEIIAGKIGLIAAGKLIRKLAAGITAILMLLGLLQLYITSLNFSLLLIGIYIIALLITGRMENALMNIRQIIYRRTRLMKKGIYPARDIVVIKSTLLGDTLRNLDFDSFHFIYLLDDDLHLLKIFTETEIMDAISDAGENISFERLLEMHPERQY